MSFLQLAGTNSAHRFNPARSPIHAQWAGFIPAGFHRQHSFRPAPQACRDSQRSAMQAGADDRQHTQRDAGGGRGVIGFIRRCRKAA